MVLNAPRPQVFQALEAAPQSLVHTLSINVDASTLEWQGIGCSYNSPAGPKEVLADVWGIAQPGEMQALLGPSGWVGGGGPRTRRGRGSGGERRRGEGAGTGPAGSPS